MVARSRLSSLQLWLLFIHEEWGKVVCGDEAGRSETGLGRWWRGREVKSSVERPVEIGDTTLQGSLCCQVCGGRGWPG